ncbi:DNA-binding transcriptional ArsR family regulator [Allocatelliglobosispora scoriae]|uniref:DNA-binding transcriptional ArsR family regulator n=1 Tax=Allocatelliglobosispora scoriae TaxID=643052 RepID=A0A841BS22_9ACTN|nr:helix-turn-helix domain-containing protein [Allocatelliglobosispora scoriae]MBB5871847.1 DNA-binding transcriptional ArsR family regulator [Allocatelliglobosispora scoriae]
MERSVRQVTEIDDLKALSHPLRVRLLGALREHGPATATELARRFETETGSTSYHLRKLAQFGFVEEVGATGTHPRERRWQAVHQLTSWSNTAFSATSEGREAISAMRRRQVEVLIRDVEHFEAAIGTLGPEWVDAAGIGDLVVSLAPATLNELWDEFYRHLDELVARDATNPLAGPTSVIVAGFPRLPAEPAEPAEPADSRLPGKPADSRLPGKPADDRLPGESPEPSDDTQEQP